MFVYFRGGGDLTICILLPACRRRKAKFATPCTYARCPHQSLRLLLPTNRALFRPAKILSAGTSRCADLRGPLKQHHPMISCSWARFTLPGACLYDTYKKMFVYFRGGGDLTICILSSMCRPRKSVEKNCSEAGSYYSCPTQNNFS